MGERDTAVRAVITDLDGTVVDGAGQLRPSVLDAVAGLAAAGVPLILATMRTPSWIQERLPALPGLAAAVCCGGSVGWEPSRGTLLFRDTVPADAVAEAARAAPGVGAYDGLRWRVTQAYAARGPDRPGPVDVVDAADLARTPACALTLCDADQRIASTLRRLPGLTVNVTGGVIDVGPEGVNKATGLRRALAVLGIDPADAIAFGDAAADVPMFGLCGRGVAVANAEPEVLLAASDTAACVHQDGFARFLARLGLCAEPAAGPDPEDCAPCRA